MNIYELVRTKKYKLFMSRLYGWGASVVMVGALFKINHYTGANTMLIVGLGTEALIFFFSAFEPPYVDPDWSLVYPELGNYHGGEKLEAKKERSVVKKLDNILEEAKIDSALIESLGKGLKKLSDNTSKLSDVTDAAYATEEYVKNVKGAASSVDELSKSYKKSAEAMNKDVSASDEYLNNLKGAAQAAAGLQNAYIHASDVLKGDMNVTKEFAGSIKLAAASANELAESYTKSAELLSKSIKSIDLSALDNSAYNEQLKKLSDSLTALNAVYELQLRDTKEQTKSIGNMQKGVAGFISNLNESMESTVKYQEQLHQLTKNVAALNNVYGNMLAAMNVKH